MYKAYRTANLPGGGLAADTLGKYHAWIVIERPKGNTALGLGNANGVPGAEQQSSPDLPFVMTYVVNHSKEKAEYREYQVVDVDLLESYLGPVGKEGGRFVFFINDCNTFADAALKYSEPRENSNISEFKRGSNPPPYYKTDIFGNKYFSK